MSLPPPPTLLPCKLGTFQFDLCPISLNAAQWGNIRAEMALNSLLPGLERVIDSIALYSLNNWQRDSRIVCSSTLPEDLAESAIVRTSIKLSKTSTLRALTS